MTDEDFTTALLKLSPDQKHCTDLLKNHFDAQAKFLCGEIKDKPVSLRLIIHGGGGYGKSFLIKIIAEFIQRMPQSLYKEVILLAPTGIAAHNIQG